MHRNRAIPVDFAPAASGDGHAHQGSYDCPYCRNDRRNRTGFISQELAGFGSGRDADRNPGTRSNGKANESISPAMAFLPDRHSRDLLLGEHLRTFSGGHHQRVVRDPVDFAADRAGTGCDAHLGSRRERLDRIPVTGAFLGYRGRRRESKQRSEAADELRCQHGR